MLPGEKPPREAKSSDNLIVKSSKEVWDRLVEIWMKIK